MQFGFKPGKGTTDASFLVGKMQKEYRDKGKPLYICFIDKKRSTREVSNSSDEFV